MSDSENSAPEVISFAKAKKRTEKHDKIIKSQKMASKTHKKRAKLNTDLLKTLEE
jgi:hypothetical protein